MQSLLSEVYRKKMIYFRQNYWKINKSDKLLMAVIEDEENVIIVYKA
jgi:hypothetical protein